MNIHKSVPSTFTNSNFKDIFDNIKLFSPFNQPQKIHVYTQAYAEEITKILSKRMSKMEKEREREKGGGKNEKLIRQSNDQWLGKFHAYRGTTEACS